MLVMLAGGSILAQPETWVAVAFLGFVGLLLYYGVPGLISKALDERADAIRKELDDARRLKDEAQKLLTDYQQKALAAEEEAKGIIEQAQKEARALAEETNKSLQESLERRTKLAEEKIKRAEAQAMSDVKDAAINAAVQATQQILKTNVTGDLSQSLIDDSIRDVKTKLN